ncbi:acyl carrier protein [Actinokineospora soli]|uniref:Acyl carrier protein n=1 Tax=Actinokineospora soli TaxID=1048753 RepID=A0ABW2TJB6_9PSEU
MRPGDNFFDIGGDSMAMAAVHARLTRATGRRVPLLDLFRHPNIRALARHLDGGGGTPSWPAPPSAPPPGAPDPGRPDPYRAAAQGDPR